MEDERKTKKQLLQELTELRSQNATLEKSSFVDQSTDFTSADTLRYAESVLETLRDPILVLDNELKIISANRSFHTTFQTTPEQTIGSFIYDLKDRQWDIPKLKELLEEIIPEEKTFDDFEITHEFQYIGHKVMLLNAREIYRKDMGTKVILLAFEDITEHKRLEGLLTDSEERYRRLFETANDGIVLLEKIHGKITHANPAITELLGCHFDDLIGKRLIHIGFPENIGNIQAILQTLEKDGILHYKDAQIRTKTQKDIDTDIYMVDKTSLVQCNIRDITERKQTEEELRKSEYQFRQLFERAPIGIFIVTAEHTIVETNKIALSILGYSREEILQMNAWDIIHPDDLRADPPQSNLRLLFSDEIVDRESRFRTRQGGYIQALINMAKLPSYSEEASHMVMFQDISERKQAEERIYNLAYYDELTALPNWRLFNDRLKQVISVSEHFGDGGVVYLVDVTRLREVNDTLGQQAGDELILEVARRIDDTVGEQVTVARVSGGEFMILSEGRSDSDRAHQLGLRILERIGQSLELPGRLVYPDVNIGYTLFPQRATDPETLIKQADLALSEAKKSALSILEFAGQEDWISRLFHLEHDLKQALVNEEFFLCYQTQIDLRSGRIVGVEALLRWVHPERGITSPGEFIPVLEQTGMIGSADEWVIHRVCKQLGSWQESGALVKTSVNLSAQELGNDATLEVVRAALEENSVHPGNLEVEVTETSLMENFDQASRILQTLSSWGVGVALDDFGKGYSSLSYLQKLAINIIKIDKQFVDGLPENKDSVTLVQTIIAMAHNLGKEVLAEGVEHEEQRQKLLELGCDYAQGFLWSRPQPVENLQLM